jgi:hypothetical protein
MIKEADDKNELRDTAVIGAVGTGSSLLSNHIANKMGINGPVAKAPAATEPLLSRVGKFFKNPGPVLKSQGFKNTLKIGALGGAIGLAGDYAAVKINKALEKKASNKYLEKAAEIYSELTEDKE